MYQKDGLSTSTNYYRMMFSWWQKKQDLNQSSYTIFIHFTSKKTWTGYTQMQHSWEILNNLKHLLWLWSTLNNFDSEQEDKVLTLSVPHPHGQWVLSADLPVQGWSFHQVSSVGWPQYMCGKGQFWACDLPWQNYHEILSLDNTPAEILQASLFFILLIPKITYSFLP